MMDAAIAAGVASAYALNDIQPGLSSVTKGYPNNRAAKLLEQRGPLLRCGNLSETGANPYPRNWPLRR